MASDAKARYRERNREKLRAAGRECAARKRREAGVPALGTPESTENRRRARKATGGEHGNWRGHAVGYHAAHEWLKRHLEKKGVCLTCRCEGRTEYAYLGTEGAYVRDVRMYVELCLSCHRRFDMTPQRRRRIGDASRGRPVSEQTRQKLREASLRWWSTSRAV